MIGQSLAEKKKEKGQVKFRSEERRVGKEGIRHLR
jgi:hypothetical protein